MFTLERQNEIMEILKKNKFISINELAKRFYISTASIRRDLEKLEQQGLVKRTYGGVMLVEGVHAEIPLVVREAEQKNAKMKIAQAAASLIRNQDTVFFDSSTTTRQICGFLGDKSNLTVITNGIRAISALAEYMTMWRFMVFPASCATIPCRWLAARRRASSGIFGRQSFSFPAQVFP